MKGINFKGKSALGAIVGASVSAFLVAFTEAKHVPEDEKVMSSIGNCDQLQAMQNNLSDHYVLTDDIDCSDTKNWNNGAGFKAIGFEGSAPFTGTFDGGTYVIRGLYINRPNGDSRDYSALFGYALGARIVNAKLEDVDIIGHENVAGLVADMEGSTIEDSYVKGSIVYIANISGGSVGGLVGYTRAVTIKNSYFIGSVTVEPSPGNQQGPSVGELIGTEGSIYTAASVIENCYVKGHVSAKHNIAGGLIGYSVRTTIKNSYASVIVTSTNTTPTSSGEEAGGLVGSTSGGRIFDSYAVGTVSGEYSVAGLVGSANSNYGPVEITNSYAATELLSSASPPLFGGLIGEIDDQYNDVKVNNSYWDKDLAKTDQSAGGGTPETTANMKKMETFKGWDSANTWDTDYPYLRNMPSSEVTKSSEVVKPSTTKTVK